MSEERVIPISQVPASGKRTNKWALLVEKALALQVGEALAVDIPEQEFSNARTSLSQQKHRYGKIDYRLKNGTVYIWRVPVMQDGKTDI